MSQPETRRDWLDLLTRISRRRWRDGRAHAHARLAQDFTWVAKPLAQRFELTNPSYRRLIGHRDCLGRTVEQAVPEAKTQGYIEILDKVYRGGKPFTASAAKFAFQLTPTGPISERLQKMRTTRVPRGERLRAVSWWWTTTKMPRRA